MHLLFVESELQNQSSGSAARRTHQGPGSRIANTKIMEPVRLGTSRTVQPCEKARLGRGPLQIDVRHKPIGYSGAKERRLDPVRRQFRRRLAEMIIRLPTASTTV